MARLLLGLLARSNVENLRQAVITVSATGLAAKKILDPIESGHGKPPVLKGLHLLHATAAA